MGGDTILLIILAVGTVLLNKEIILAEWFTPEEGKNSKK